MYFSEAKLILTMIVVILVLTTSSITLGSQSSLVTAQIQPVHEQQQSQQSQKALTLGTISQNSNNSIFYQPLANYIVSKLSAGKEGKVVVADSANKMVDQLKNQSVDLYLDSSLISAFVDNKSGAVPFLRGWNNGIPQDHSDYITRKDSMVIYQLPDLASKSIGFGDAHSNFGYLLPKSYLQHLGYRFTPPSSTADLFYIFTGSDNKTVTQILNGSVGGGNPDVGAISSNYYDHLPASIKSQLKVVNSTNDVPIDIMSHRSGLPADLVGGVRDILLNMNKDPAGAKILSNLGNETKFDAIPNQQATIKLLTKMSASALNGTTY